MVHVLNNWGLIDECGVSYLVCCNFGGAGGGGGGVFSAVSYSVVGAKL